MTFAKGTGINIHNVITVQMNCNFSLDGGSSSAFVYSPVPGCFSDVTSGCYNASVYNSQSLSYGAHTLNITLLSYLGSNTVHGYTDFYLDYVVISTENLEPSNRQSQYVSFLLGLQCTDITQ
jgi:hypothetical protein